MSTAHLGTVLLALIFVVIGIWDIYCLMVGKDQETVSALIWIYSTRFPVIPFFAGFLCGHLFFR